MVRFYSLRTQSEDRVSTRRSRRADVPLQRDMLACESYHPGHQMHYIHQGRALRSPSRRAQSIVVDDHRVTVSFEDGERLDWFHHDPARLTSVLGLFPTSRVVYDDYHALRIGPYWFNCAVRDFVPCASLPEADPVP
jgi:hypothetical protein